MPELDGRARALARIPSGLFVLSVGRGERPAAMLVSFVQQVGFEPPAVTCALNKGGRGHVLQRLRGEGLFCLAVVPAGGTPLVSHFAAGFAPEADPFAGVPTALAVHGVRYPAEACAHLACELAGEADFGDHLLLCGRVVGGDARPGVQPWVHLRKNGLSY
jgi:flavin reductase (DIM6/NTAB) family NADH-FMN oxidoreductase RutF